MPTLEEQQRRPVTSIASQIPGSTYAAPPADGSQDSLLNTDLGRNVVNTALAVPALRPAGAVVGAVSKVAAAGAGAAGGAGKLLPYGAPAAGMGALQMAAAPAAPAAQGPVGAPAAPAAVRPVSAATSPARGNPIDVPLAPASAPSQVGGAPGVRRLIDASGKVLYTNVTDDADNASLMARGAPAAGTLNTIPAGPVSAMSAPAPAAALPAGAGVSVMPDRAAERNAQFDRQTLLDAARRKGGRALNTILGFVGGQDRIAAEASASATREAGADRRLAVSEQGAAARQREQIAATDRREGPAAAVRTQAAQLEVQARQELQSAQTAYQRAVAGGDAKAITAAETSLRALTGKWEKEVPELFSATPIPGGIDPLTGQARGSGAIVLNKRTGEARVIGPDEAKGAGGAPAAQFQTGKVYKDAAGNRAKWDGKQFVPVS